MSDRDLTKSGVPVNLFGEPTMLPAGPAKLALATGAALLPVHSHFEPDVAVTAIGAPLDISSGDVGTIIQALADEFTTNIAAHPADWHMLQPQWLADLSDERRSRLAGAGGPPACGGERSDPGSDAGAGGPPACGGERSDPGIDAGGQEAGAS
jgi:phosphatidylinositol dimannoside acyltransferase